mgnify:CR=1 FL=1
MFLRVGLLESLNIIPDLPYMGTATYLADCARKCQASKNDINELFELDESNNFRRYFNLPTSLEKLESEPIVVEVKKQFCEAYKNSKVCKTTNIKYNSNEVVFDNDKNVYKFSKMLAKVLDSSELKICIQEFNKLGIYPFEITAGNFITCFMELRNALCKKVVVSTNFEDFILSANQLSWSTCMKLNGYNNGFVATFSNDPHFFVVGVVEPYKFENRFNNRYISRRWGYKFGNIIGVNGQQGSAVAEPSLNGIIDFFLKKLGKEDVISYADNYKLLISCNKINFERGRSITYADCSTSYMDIDAVDKSYDSEKKKLDLVKYDTFVKNEKMQHTLLPSVCMMCGGELAGCSSYSNMPAKICICQVCAKKIPSEIHNGSLRAKFDMSTF